MNELALFAGTGGGILGGYLLGWRTVCAVEYNAYARSVLLARQNDRTLPPFPIWDDVRTFDGKPWRGIVDVVSGGFPCQDISGAGKGAGINGEKSGLWSEMARIICEVQPGYVYVENSPMLTSRGLGRVLGDLAEMGFDAQWGVLGAADCGALHKRKRIWIMAYAHRMQSERGGISSELDGQARKNEIKKEKRKRFRNAVGNSGEDEASAMLAGLPRGWPTEPDVGRVVDGMAHRVDRLKALGNGQVPRVAATAWEILKNTGEKSVQETSLIGAKDA